MNINDYEVFDTKPKTPYRELPEFGETASADFDEVSEEFTEADSSEEEVAEPETVVLAPTNLLLVGQTVYEQADGTYKVDVDISFDGVDGAEKYEVRVA